MEGDLRVLVAELFNGGRSEGSSGWVVQWREVCMREQLAGLFNGGRSEGASG